MKTNNSEEKNNQFDPNKERDDYYIKLNALLNDISDDELTDYDKKNVAEWYESRDIDKEESMDMDLETDSNDCQETKKEVNNINYVVNQEQFDKLNYIINNFDINKADALLKLANYLELNNVKKDENNKEENLNTFKTKKIELFEESVPNNNPSPVCTNEAYWTTENYPMRYILVLEQANWLMKNRLQVYNEIDIETLRLVVKQDHNGWVTTAKVWVTLEVHYLLVVSLIMEANRYNEECTTTKLKIPKLTIVESGSEVFNNAFIDQFLPTPDSGEMQRINVSSKLY